MLNAVTLDASVRCFQIGHEIPLARMNVHKVAHADVASLSSRTLRVHVGDDVLRAAHVEIAVEAPAQFHPAVGCGRHQYYATVPAGGVERLVKTEITTTVCKFINMLHDNNSSGGTCRRDSQQKHLRAVN
jgi:hypothetical protein